MVSLKIRNSLTTSLFIFLKKCNILWEICRCGLKELHTFLATLCAKFGVDVRKAAETLHSYRILGFVSVNIMVFSF